MTTERRLLGDRDATIIEVSHYNLLENTTRRSHDNNEEYATSLAQCLFGQKLRGPLENEKILALTSKPPKPLATHHETLRIAYARSPTKPVALRHIETQEKRTFAAPGLIDDYFAKTIDWSAHDMIAVALGSALYMRPYTETTTSPMVTKLCELDNSLITGVAWSPDVPHYIALGASTGMVSLWDTTRELQVRALCGHTERVQALDWCGAMLTSGSHDSTIRQWDVRMRNACVNTFVGHAMRDVCSLAWSGDGTQLACGDRTSCLTIWSCTHTERPLFTIDDAHSAAVKALAWCPWQSNLLASGGGSGDRAIHFWNTLSGTLLDSLETDGQITALQWLPATKELVSSHGFGKNAIIVWKYPTMQPIVELTGHEGRVLDLSLSASHDLLLSAGADETLKIWAIGKPSSQAFMERHLSIR